MQENKTISDYKKQLKSRILKTAMQAFSERGIRAVRMDDISNALSISKRTLYEIYENKEDLLFEGIKERKRLTREKYKEVAQNSDSVMDMILYIYRSNTEEMRHTAPTFYEDLQKYPHIMQWLEEDKDKNREQFFEFMSLGVTQGYFRADINYELVSLMFDALSQYLMEHRLYQRFSPDELFRNLIFVTLRGFCTQKGVEKLDSFMK